MGDKEYWERKGEEEYWEKGKGGKEKQGGKSEGGRRGEIGSRIKRIELGIERKEREERRRNIIIRGMKMKR